MYNEMPPTVAQAGPMKGTVKELNSCINHNKLQEKSQVHVSDFLHHGSDSAVSCRELAALLGWEPRAVTHQIEIERRSGVAICANGTGYYLAADDAELERYLYSLQRRENEIRRTRAGVATGRQQRMQIGDGGAQ